MGNQTAAARRQWKERIKSGEVINCALCGEPIPAKPSKKDRLKYGGKGSISVDHILPLAAGGRSNKENLQPTHLKCNMDKGEEIMIMLPDGPIKIKKTVYESDIQAVIKILKKLSEERDAPATNGETMPQDELLQTITDTVNSIPEESEYKVYEKALAFDKIAKLVADYLESKVMRKVIDKQTSIALAKEVQEIVDRELSN